MIGSKRIAALCFAALFLAGAAPAAAVTQSPQLQKCLKRADELPDIAAAEAEAWFRKGGGDDARLCRAFAQSNRGEHETAGRDFAYLADRARGAQARALHDLAGHDFLRAKDAKQAKAQFDAALKISPGDTAALTGRAEALMQDEHYWDAIDDLNRILRIWPNDAEALRQRGLAWTRLGNDAKAKEDLEAAHAAESKP
ncbi:MAG: tetratricopeptide repeat protein [Alphaproteobacteria bacterium]|nr:tetratricopeptide repeat protein [Alphaproteobacteria bacterium]